MLADVALLANDSGRTRAYLDVLISRDLAPSAMVLLAPSGPPRSLARVDTERFDNSVPAAEMAGAAGIPVIRVAESDVNAPAVVDAIAGLDQSIVVFSVTGGAIVKDPLFGTGKRFLHVHPGALPAFRGSTTVYYALLAGEPLTATALFLAPDIDAGPVIASRDYPPPPDRRTMDLEYDPWMRADLLSRVLETYQRTGAFDEASQRQGEVETYYIIHPVLRHIAILGQ